MAKEFELNAVSDFGGDHTGIGEFDSLRIDLKGLAFGLWSFRMNGLSLGSGFNGSGSSMVVQRYGDQPTCFDPRLEGRTLDELAVFGVAAKALFGVLVSLSSMREPGLGGVGGRAGRGPSMSTMI